MTMKKERLRDLWKCRNTPTVRPKRNAVDKAVQSACNGQIRTLEIERSALKAKLATMSDKFRNRRHARIAVDMADLIVKIENLDLKIKSLNI